MSILTSIIYIIIFLFFMVFVFFIGLLRPFMPKKELIIIFIAAFLIGSLSGAFFLTPVYDELPEFVYEVEKLIPSNVNGLSLDIPYSTDIDTIMKDLSSMDGVKSFKVTGATIYTSKLSDSDVNTIDNALCFINNNYASWNINRSGQIDFTIKDNTSISSALQSFFDWYELAYDMKLGSAIVHIDILVSSSQVETVNDYLIQHNIIPLNYSDPTGVINNVNDVLLSTNQFIVCCGVFGVFVSLLGVYFDNILLSFKKFRKWARKKH